jgi:hypothetical protein
MIDSKTRIKSFNEFINELAIPIGNLSKRDSVILNITLADNLRGFLSRETLE